MDIRDKNRWRKSDRGCINTHTLDKEAEPETELRTTAPVSSGNT